MDLDKYKVEARTWIKQMIPQLNRYKYALIVLLAGIILLYAGGGGARDRPQQTKPDENIESAGFNLEEFQSELTDKLMQIDGVGRVELMLSLEQTGEAVYASDIRQSQSSEQSGSFERTLSTVSDGSYGEQPVRITQTCPVFRGAVVLCDGADNDQVRLAVTQAVRAVCGLGTDRISVIRMEQ